MGELKKGISYVRRKEAQSGQVSYAEPTVLHESSKTRVVAVPFYVRRTDGTDLSIKIQTFKKQTGLPPMLVEEKSITLKDRAARQLLRVLNEHFAVAKHNEDGNYIVIKVSDGQADYGDVDTSLMAGAVMELLKNKSIVEHLNSKELRSELLAAFQGAIRLQEMRTALAILRENLENNVVKEQVYQEWCQEHIWAFGNAYVVCDNMRSISANDNLDLLLPSVITGFRDIVELKRPDMDVLNYDSSHMNYYFAHEVTKAIGQCHRYLDVFSEEAANGLRDSPEIIAYHPRATIVIGRSNNWGKEKQKALHGLNKRLTDISITTYDQLLIQGERLLEILGSGTLDDDTDFINRDYAVS